MRKLIVYTTAFLLLALLIVPVAMAANLVVTTEPAQITAHPGETVPYTIYLTATGSISGYINPISPATATVTYSTDGVTTTSSPFKFYASTIKEGTSGNYRVTWNSAPSVYTIMAEYVAPTTPSDYPIKIAISNPKISNPKDQGGKLDYNSAYSPIIKVTALIPDAGFTATPTSGTAPLEVSFMDTSTNTPTSWSWSFGDGQTSTVQSPSNTYTIPGTYTVTLTATNTAGSTTKTFDITVNPAVEIPDAGFTATPTSGTAPLEVSFMDTSTNTPTSWSWSFGDGQTSTVQSPSNTYTIPGTYTVTLTATNTAGSTTKTFDITVTEAPLPSRKILSDGNWILGFNSQKWPSGNPYPHDMIVTGNTATGGTPAGRAYIHSWTATVDISGNDVTIVSTYITGPLVGSNYKFTAIGTIANDGTISGTWTDTEGDGGTWYTITSP